MGVDSRLVQSLKSSLVFRQAAPAGSSCGISIVVCARMFLRHKDRVMFLSAILVVLKTAVEVLSL